MDIFSMLFGGVMPNENFKEIVKLHEMLEEANIPHTYTPYMGGYSIRYFGKNNFSESNGIGIADYICSAIEHNMSYGNEQDLIEIQGLTDGSDVQGGLTAKEVFNRIKKHYESC